MLNLKEVLIANSYDPADDVQKEDKKKTLDEIAKVKSSKRLKTFIGRSVRFIDDFV